MLTEKAHLHAMLSLELHGVQRGVSWMVTLCHCINEDKIKQGYQSLCCFERHLCLQTVIRRFIRFRLTQEIIQ